MKQWHMIAILNLKLKLNLFQNFKVLDLNLIMKITMKFIVV